MNLFFKTFDKVGEWGQCLNLIDEIRSKNKTIQHVDKFNSPENQKEYIYLNEVSYHNIINCLNKGSQYKLAYDMYLKMLHENVKPDINVINSLLSKFCF